VSLPHYILSLSLPLRPLSSLSIVGLETVNIESEDYYIKNAEEETVFYFKSIEKENRGKSWKLVRIANGPNKI
jgi:hypothetical protein